MKYLNYPFDANLLLKKKKSIKRELLESKKILIQKNIAILGGSTTDAIKDMLEIFLLKEGIESIFYESEYNQYWQDAMFDPPELIEFKPDIIFIHTTTRNIINFPTIETAECEIEDLLAEQFEHFHTMWKHLEETYHCPIIQNNFERPYYRLLGNKDVSDTHGYANFVYRLNGLFYAFAQDNANFYIHDIDYISASYGLIQWSDPFYWHMYKYAVSIPAIPEFAYNLANIIKSIYGKNKKAFVLDMDNTLWGGVIGDDGLENIALGPEMPMGQVFSEFQQYILEMKRLGIVLTICSKNEEENALLGLTHSDSRLTQADFVSIKANWHNKDQNIVEIAEELNLGIDSFVFIDDNPAERALICEQLQEVSVPELTKPEYYIHHLDRNGFFEMTHFSSDDLKRSQMYQENKKRKDQQKAFANYESFLKSLDMQAIISSFEPLYLSRIAQLTNKSNQFNLTTKRYTESDIQAVMNDPRYITLYGKLKDKFGDNGVVSIIIGAKKETELHIDLWLMSCRVLKRNMEYAMLDSLVELCKKYHIEKIIGYYYPTTKNGMVREFYRTLGFEKMTLDDNINSIWAYDINKHLQKNNVILVNL